MISSDKLERALALFSAEAMDVASIGLYLADKIQSEENLSATGIMGVELIKNSFLEVRRAGYLAIGIGLRELEYGNFNVRDYLTDICMSLNNYLSNTFGVEIVYNISEEDDVNAVFEANLVERAIYDAVFGLFGGSGIKGRKISIYAKDLSKHIKISVRSSCAVKARRKSFTEVGLLFPELKDRAEKTSYAELAMGQMNGICKEVYGRNDAKIELYIPKGLKVSSTSMKEEETAIRNGERVMVYKPCSQGVLEMLFARTFIDAHLNNEGER